jgi:hypothetical protein
MQSAPTKHRPMRAWALRLAAVAAVLTSSLATAADIAERKFIREGMGEGEVLFKIGQPDHEAFIRNVKGEPEEKAWTYFPQPQDYQTLTIVTFRAGVVAKVERKIQR